MFFIEAFKLGTILTAFQKMLHSKGATSTTFSKDALFFSLKIPICEQKGQAIVCPEDAGDIIFKGVKKSSQNVYINLNNRTQCL